MEKFPEHTDYDELTKKAVALYKKIAREARSRGWSAVFLSGFAFDAHVGYITRNHRDVDLMIPKSEALELKTFLEGEGHEVYEEEKSRGEAFKVDNTNPDRLTKASCDIHFFWDDENGRATIPLRGRELKFTTGSDDIYDELEFLGNKASFLKPKYLMEEKVGWIEQIGLPKREGEYERDVANLELLLSS